MPRPHRIRIPGISQHVVQRGNDRRDIFRCDDDRRVFLAMLRKDSTRHETEIHGYVVMTNHFHLLVTPMTSTALERTMQVVESRYAGYFNRRHKRTGTPFSGRYKSAVVEDERYWITCLRYIELNPVRAGLAATPDEYPWSSFRANAFGSEDPLISPHQRYLDLGPTASARQAAWSKMCAEPLSTEDLDRMRFAAFENRVLGLASRDISVRPEPVPGTLQPLRRRRRS